MRKRPKPNSISPPMTKAPIAVLSVDAIFNLFIDCCAPGLHSLPLIQRRSHELSYNLIVTLVQFFSRSLRENVSLMQDDKLVADSSRTRNIVRDDNHCRFLQC